MNGWVHWRDAVAAAERLAESDRRTLRLLSHLPFLWEGAIEQLSGARAGSPVYRCLSRLRETGLVGEIHPALSSTLSILRPAQAANARVPVRRSKRARGISTTSSDDGEVEKTAMGQRSWRTKARVSEKVGAVLAYQAAWRTGRG